MKPSSGFTLIELIVAMAIAAVLLRIGIASYGTMMASVKSRTIAESMLSGLRLARAEAIKRNVPMRFQLVSVAPTSTTLDNTCFYSFAGPRWVVSQGDTATTNGVAGVNHGLVANHCASAPYTPPDQPDICPVGSPVGKCSVGQTTLCRGPAIAANPNPNNCEDDPLIAYKSDDASYTGIAVTGTSSAGCDPYVVGCAQAAVVTFGPLGRVSSNSVGGNSLAQIDVTPVNADDSRNTDANRWRIQIAAGNGSLRLCNPDAAASTSQACR